MLRSMPVRRFKRGFKLGLIKLLIGNKATGEHLSYVGQGASADLCRRILDIGHTDILVVTDKALKELGLAERALAPLADAGVNLHWYAGVDPDPTFSHVTEGAEVLRAAGCTAIVAVGGGSSMDAAKIIACTRTSDESPDKWVGLNKVPDDVLPIYAIPTTSGTGSEATMGAVIKDPEEKLKHIIVGEDLLPQAVALDPDLLLGLPAPVTAATGIDALTDDWVDLGDEIKWLKGIKPATIIGFYKAKNGRIPEMGDPAQKKQMKKICKFIGVNFEQCEQLLLADLAK